MKLDGCENDEAIKLIANRKNGLKDLDRCVFLCWLANSKDYQISVQQIAFELNMKETNVSRSFANLCKKEWLTYVEISKNKWNTPINQYLLHPRIAEIIAQIVAERTHKSLQGKSAVTPTPNDPKADGEPTTSPIVQKFEEFKEKFSLGDMKSRKEHGTGIIAEFFKKHPITDFTQSDFVQIRNQFINLFCHKSAKMSYEQFESWKNEISKEFMENALAIYGKEKVDSLLYVPNDKNIQKIKEKISAEILEKAKQNNPRVNPEFRFDENNFESCFIKNIDLKLQKNKYESDDYIIDMEIKTVDSIHNELFPADPSSSRTKLAPPIEKEPVSDQEWHDYLEWMWEAELAENAKIEETILEGLEEERLEREQDKMIRDMKAEIQAKIQNNNFTGVFK